VLKRLFVLLTLVLLAGVNSVAAAIAAQPPDASQIEPLDEELIVKVRLAGLWEMPAGDMAQDRSSDPKVKEIGRTLMGDHAKLDEAARTVAAQFNLPLPAEPNDAQKSWLTEMASATGSRFDRIWAERLRAAHGVIFPLIAQVRASTRNPVVREFATTSNAFVLKHMSIIEGTGKVDFTTLSNPTPIALQSDSEGIDIVVAIALVPLMVAITVFVLWMMSSRRGRRRSRTRSAPSKEESTHSRLFVEKEMAR
jgi:predicted outer membrane protein